MNATKKNELPQEGTDRPAVGESLSTPTEIGVFSPPYSGGAQLRADRCPSPGTTIGMHTPSFVRPTTPISASSRAQSGERRRGYRRAPTMEHPTTEPVQGQEMEWQRGESGDSDASSFVSVSSRPAQVRKRKPKELNEEKRPTKVARSGRRAVCSGGSGTETGTETERESAVDPSTPLVRPEKEQSREVEVITELKGQPTADIDLKIQESLSVVEKAFIGMKGARGGKRAAAKEAMTTVRAGVSELLTRNDTSALTDAVRRLEQENEALRSQMASLQKELEKLRNGGPKRNPPGSKERTGRATSPKRSRATMTHPEPELILDQDQYAVTLDRVLAEVRSKMLGKQYPERNASSSSNVANGVGAMGVNDTLPPKNKKRKRRKAQRATSQPASTRQQQTAAPTTSESWAVVVGRKAKAKAAKKAAPAPKKNVVPRPPTNAAVTISVPPGSETKIAALMETAKANINLGDLGIAAGLRTKRALTGALILQIPGEGSAALADKLAERLREVLIDTDAIIARPCRTGDLRVMDLEESITQAEVAKAIVDAGGCAISDIKVGAIRISPSRLSTAWVRCPLAAVRKIANAKRVQVGWVSARVEALAARPLQCYRCLELGHVKAKCPNETDRGARCYVCSGTGHVARTCTAKTPRCPVCSDLGRPANHRLGSKNCSPPKKKKRGLQTAPNPVLASTDISQNSPAARTRQPGTCPAEESMEA